MHVIQENVDIGSYGNEDADRGSEKAFDQDIEHQNAIVDANHSSESVLRFFCHLKVHDFKFSSNW